MKSFATIMLSVVMNITFGQTLSSEIDSIYTFKPSKLSNKDQETKLPLLDKFWEKVKRDTTKYLPQLRTELNQMGHNPFFYYDGSALILTLSETKQDQRLAVNAIAKCDLEDIDRKIYVSTINKLAYQGINVTPAAVRILHDDNFSFSIPEHAMIFNQSYSLVYMLLPQNDYRYIDTLISMFPIVNNTAKVSIMVTLWVAYSCKGDEFLKAIFTDQKVDKLIQDYAKEVIQTSGLTKEEQAYINIIGNGNLDEMRNLALRRFSDEAVDELFLTTKVMRNQKNCH